MEIRGQRLLLRDHRESDIPALVRCANDREVWRNLDVTFPHPYTEVDARGWIDIANGNRSDACHLAIDRDGEFIGVVGVDRRAGLQSRSAAIGYWLGRAHWGHGYATEALQLMTAHAFSAYDFLRCDALILDWNLASGRVLEKAGYTFEGRLRGAGWKDDHVVDLLMYARLREKPRGGGSSRPGGMTRR